MDIELKGGFETSDPRLDRIPQYDSRNRNFLAVRTLEAKKPRSYTWSCSIHLDQGFEGACVGFSFAHDAIARPVRLFGIDQTYARERIYWQAQREDDWEGGSYPMADPFYEGTSVLAGAKAAQALGLFANYEWAYNVDDLILAVGYKGPAILGLNWHEGMFDPDESGFLRPTGQVAGGHAIMVNKVSLKERYFGLHNSWGLDWGQGGNAKINFDDMSVLLASQGEACVPIKRSSRLLG